MRLLETTARLVRGLCGFAGEALDARDYYRCGHRRTEENTIINKWGSAAYRRCRQCHLDNNRFYKAKVK